MLSLEFRLVHVVGVKNRSSSRDLLHPCQVHPRSKFGDRRYKYFNDDLKSSKVGHGDLVIGVRLRLRQCAHKIASLCMQRLRFVPPWLSQNVFCAL